MAIYTTIQLSINEYAQELVHIFIDSLNSIYLILIQISRPTLHLNHLDKIILSEIVTMLQQRMQHTTITKVKAHSKIKGNEIANHLAKEGHLKQHYHPALLHEHAHSTPYYLQKNYWKGSIARTPYKGPIRHFQRYLIKYDRKFHLEAATKQFPSISKWTHNKHI